MIDFGGLLLRLREHAEGADHGRVDEIEDVLRDHPANDRQGQQQQVEVSVVELLEEIARDMEAITRAMTLKRLDELPVEVHTRTRLVRLENGEAFVVDGDGRKMSKSLCNVVSPQDVIRQSGAEILRLWVAAEDYRDDIKISQEILDRLLVLTQVQIEVEQDPARLRPSDVPTLIGDSTRFREATGWEPQIPFEQTPKDLLEYWRSRTA